MNIKNYWNNLPYFKRGILISIGLYISFYLLSIFIALVQYDGTCPLGGAKCTFNDYLTTHLLLNFFILTFGFGWIIFPILLIFPLIGYSIDKIKSKGADKRVAPKKIKYWQIFPLVGIAVLLIGFILSYLGLPFFYEDFSYILDSLQPLQIILILAILTLIGYFIDKYRQIKNK